MKDNKRLYIVYKHTYIPDGRIYIGITSRSLKERCGPNGRRYNAHTHFGQAIRKYGWENFSHEILLENLTEKEAKEKEIELIAKYNSTNKDIGFNTSAGGDGTVGVKMSEEAKHKLSLAKKGQPNPFQGKHHTEEAKRKISEAGRGRIPAMKGKHYSEEIRKRMSEAQRRRDPSTIRRGFHLSEETKEKIRQYNLGRKRTEEDVLKQKINNKTTRPVRCVETNQIYISKMEAGKAVNRGRTPIEHAANTGGTSAGYHWVYVDKDSKEYIDFINNILKGFNEK